MGSYFEKRVEERRQGDKEEDERRARGTMLYTSFEASLE